MEKKDCANAMMSPTKIPLAISGRMLMAFTPIKIRAEKMMGTDRKNIFFIFLKLPHPAFALRATAGRPGPLPEGEGARILFVFPLPRAREAGEWERARVRVFYFLNTLLINPYIPAAKKRAEKANVNQGDVPFRLSISNPIKNPNKIEIANCVPSATKAQGLLSEGFSGGVVLREGSTGSTPREKLFEILPLDFIKNCRVLRDPFTGVKAGIIIRACQFLRRIFL